MLSNYVRALIWALVLAIALWPLFQRASAKVAPRLRGEILPALFVIGVALIFVVPFAVLGVEAVREAHNVLDYGKQAEANGIPVPDAVNRLPAKVAQPVSNWWNENLAHSGWAKDLAEKVDTASNRELGKNVGRDAVHRIVLFGFALLALFFPVQGGRQRGGAGAQSLAQPVRPARRADRPADRRLDPLAPVNGLVLVGLGEGVVLGIRLFLHGRAARDPARRLHPR